MVLTLKLLLALAISAVFLASVDGYSSGAPPSDEICTSMRPNHPGDPQTSTFPYGLKVDKRRVKAGEPVTLQISGTKEQPFKGFLVQGRRTNYEKETTPIGSFLVAGNDVMAQTINCGGGDSNAITHASGDEKTLVKLQWTAPKEPGTYTLLTTVVHSGKIYWVRNPSANITVTE